MGHMLASVNPEAAAQIQEPEPAPRLPPISTLVQYTCRQGYGRGGRTRFPAMVCGHGDRGTLSLLVFFDAADMIDESLVERAGPGVEFHCWEVVDDAHILVNGLRNTVSSLHTRVGELEQSVVNMKEVVLGDFEPPAVSIIHIMQDFENRLRGLGQQIQAMGGKPAAAAKPARTSKKK